MDSVIILIMWAVIALIVGAMILLPIFLVIGGIANA